jgi:hypothetical protein
MNHKQQAYANNICIHFKLTESGHSDWIKGAIGLAEDFYQARQEFLSNQEFAVWLAENELDYFDKDDRAALINLGEHLEVTKEVLKETKSISYRLIWRDEVQPRVRNVANTTGCTAEPENSEKDAVLPTETDNASATEDVFTSQAEKVLPSRTIREKINQTEIDDINARHARIIRSAAEMARLSPTNPIRQFERYQEVVPLFTAHGLSAINKAVAIRNGKEIWNLILASLDNGFLKYSNLDFRSGLTARALFTGSPASGELSRLVLTNKTDRDTVKNIIFPAAIANRDAIIAEPQRISSIIGAYRQAQFVAEQKAKKEKAYVELVAKLPPNQLEVIAYGVPLWPIDPSDYDYDQLRAACWTFNGLLCFLTATPKPESPASIAITIRNSIKWLGEYALFRSQGQKEFKRIFTLIHHISYLYETNPDANCKWPYTPNVEGEW